MASKTILGPATNIIKQVDKSRVGDTKNIRIPTWIFIFERDDILDALFRNPNFNTTEPFRPPAAPFPRTFPPRLARRAAARREL